VGGLVIGVAQSPTGPVLASLIGPVLILTAVLAAAVVASVLVLVLIGGLSSNRRRGVQAREMVELLLYALHRRTRPDLDLYPATLIHGIASASRRSHARSTRPSPQSPDQPIGRRANAGRVG
jgi:hypothetical protein